MIKRKLSYLKLFHFVFLSENELLLIAIVEFMDVPARRNVPALLVAVKLVPFTTLFFFLQS